MKHNLNMKQRCSWVNLKNKNYINYHDTERGVPVYEDQTLFEMLTLEGAQAGLSWEIVLNKRDDYRKLFFNFDIQKCINLTDEYLEQLHKNAAIVRNKRKIFSVRQNAKVFKNIQKEFGSFSSYIWSWTDGKIIKLEIVNCKDDSTKTHLSERISKDLKKRGMNFVGPTIIYAYLQAIGVVNAHEKACFCKD